ncbi:MAG: hypothetical protein MJZ03_04000 [archaeon]|nr:hypothetical protein [archaeon]
MSGGFRKENKLKEGDREYNCANGHTYGAPANYCWFCKHCDIFWDYSNGPWGVMCDINKDYDHDNRQCEYFDDKEEVFFDDTSDS